MKYIKPTQTGFELREDNYPLQDGCIELTNEQWEGLINETLIFINGEIVNA